MFVIDGELRANTSLMEAVYSCCAHARVRARSLMRQNGCHLIPEVQDLLFTRHSRGSVYSTGVVYMKEIKA
jgi:hypothetical protein